MFADDSKADGRNPYGNSTMAYAEPVSDPAHVSGSNPFVIKQQPKRCRDPIFAVLFYVNVAAIVVVCSMYGGDLISDMGNDDAMAADDSVIVEDFTGFLYAVLAAAAFSTVLSALITQVMMCIPGTLIKAALIFNVTLAGLAALFGFVSGDLFTAIFSLIFFALMLCYARAVWDRIPFATANLKTACTAIKANCGVTIVAYFFVFATFAWTVLWAVAFGGIQNVLIDCEEVQDENGEMTTFCQNPNFGLLFLMFISLFFTQQVLQNCVQTTVSGVVGTWWFTPGISGFCGSAVMGSVFRTLTTSFGSICMGSLIVAIIQALRQLAETARQNQDVSPFLACCIDCILSCIQSIVEYFNKWAFVYVGLYGYSYCEAGKSVIQLFKDRGWEAVIADDLVGMVLFMASLIVGLITGAVTIEIEEAANWFDDYPDLDENGARLVAFFIGLIVGLILCSIFMSVISAGVNATIVLFAEGPAEFEKNHPALSAQMREAYIRAHPGCI